MKASRIVNLLSCGMGLVAGYTILDDWKLGLLFVSLMFNLMNLSITLMLEDY